MSSSNTIQSRTHPDDRKFGIEELQDGLSIARTIGRIDFHSLTEAEKADLPYMMRNLQRRLENALSVL